MSPGRGAACCAPRLTSPAGPLAVAGTTGPAPNAQPRLDGESNLPTLDRRADERGWADSTPQDRKSTRLNSSHSQISYAVFCLKKKKNYSDPVSRHSPVTRETSPHTAPPVDTEQP